MKTDKNMQK